jgi:hypothetical protein
VALFVVYFALEQGSYLARQVVGQTIQGPSVFDDTGATNPTIRPQDLQAPGIQQDYVGWSFLLTHETANSPLEL